MPKECYLNFKDKRILISLATYVVWVVITMIGAQIVVGSDISLIELVNDGIGWHFLVSIAVLVAVIVIFHWNDIGFNRPRSIFRTMWFPSIYLCIFLAGLIYFGMPPTSVVIFIVLNTFLVGVSEEVMFRGILFRAFEQTMSIWPAILLTSFLFGAVHALNVFITGELGLAIMQSIAAGMSGLVFLAIVLRTGSLWTAIVYHFLWDCLLFLLGASAPEVGQESSDSMIIYGPILLNLPNTIFALILLRNIAKERSATAKESICV